MAESLKQYKVTYVDYAHADSADEAVEIVRASIGTMEVILGMLMDGSKMPNARSTPRKRVKGESLGSER